MHLQFLHGGTQYYFAIKSKDEHNRWSNISNVANNVTAIFDVTVDGMGYLRPDNPSSPYTNYLYDKMNFYANITNRGNTAQQTIINLEEGSNIISTQNILIQPGQTITAAFINITLSLSGTSVPYFIKATTVGGGTREQYVNIPVINITNTLNFNWYNPTFDLNATYNNSQCFSTSCLPTARISPLSSINLYKLPIIIQLNQSFTINSSSGCGTNTTCYWDITATGYKVWRLNTLPVGNYTATITAGKYSQDSITINRSFEVID